MSEFYTITKGHPMPHGRVRSATGPIIMAMEVGDSFDAPDDLGFTAKGGNQSKRRSRLVAETVRHRRNGNPTKKFTTRIIGDVVRVWRVA